MFGGQDDNAAAPQTDGGAAPQDDPLKGVAELVGGSAPAVGPNQGDGQGGMFLPKPADTPQPDAPALPDNNAPMMADANPTSDDSRQAADNNDLLDLKQQALQQLTPLVGHLEQSPLEKFRTTMMLIQASDNESLLKDAYEAAQNIEDEKIRAQALLDVVNEINYFTQNKDQ